MDVRLTNQINNKSPQESGVFSRTFSQICGGYFNKNLNRGKRLPHGGKCGTGHRNLLSPPRLLMGDGMNKYKASFLPTGRSRKIRSLFFYTSNDAVAINTVEERVREQHPDGEVISLQGPDKQFLEIGK